MLKVSAAVRTDPGLRREGNEDSYCRRDDLGLYLVADGMGGHAAGEVASRLAADSVEDFIDDTRDHDVNRTWPFPYDPGLSMDGNRLESALRLANRRIGAAIAERDELRGMATTTSAVLLGEHSVTLGHVGDSRVYLWRDGALEQLTRDHSWVGEQVRAGALSDADARQHPWRNVVTRALTGGEDPAVDVDDVPVRAGDRLLICCDGLSSVVANERIAEIVGSRAPLDEIAAQLVQAANDAGGPDNITVVVINVDVG